MKLKWSIKRMWLDFPHQRFWELWEDWIAVAVAVRLSAWETLKVGPTVNLTLAFFSSMSGPSYLPRLCSIGFPPKLIFLFLDRDFQKLLLDKLCQVFLSQLSIWFSQRPTIWFTLKASIMKGTDTATEIPTICVSIKKAEGASRLRNSHKYPDTWCSCQEVIPLESLGNCATLNAKNVAMNDRGSYRRR